MNFELSEEQLVNFLLLCHQMEYGVGEEEEERYKESSSGYAFIKVDQEKNRYHPLCFQIEQERKNEGLEIKLLEKTTSEDHSTKSFKPKKGESE